MRMGVGAPTDAAHFLNATDETHARPHVPRVRRRAARAAPRTRDRAPSRHAPVRHERRPGGRHPRGARAALGAGRLRAAVPGGPHRGERRARGARARAARRCATGSSRAGGSPCSATTRGRTGS
jgi:hypothetical protein